MKFSEVMGRYLNQLGDILNASSYPAEPLALQAAVFYFTNECLRQGLDPDLLLRNVKGVCDAHKAGLPPALMDDDGILYAFTTIPASEES